MPEGRRIMTTQCVECEYEVGNRCVRCGSPEFAKPLFDADALSIEMGAAPIEREGLEITLKVGGFEFKVSLEDEGIMFSTPYDYHGDGPEDPKEMDEEAWAELDALLGFDARQSAVDRGVGGAWPPMCGLSAVSYAVVPYEMALLVRRGVEQAFTRASK